MPAFLAVEQTALRIMSNHVLFSARTMLGLHLRSLFFVFATLVLWTGFFPCDANGQQSIDIASGGQVSGTLVDKPNDLLQGWEDRNGTYVFEIKQATYATFSLSNLFSAGYKGRFGTFSLSLCASWEYPPYFFQCPYIEGTHSRYDPSLGGFWETRLRAMLEPGRYSLNVHYSSHLPSHIIDDKSINMQVSGSYTLSYGTVPEDSNSSNTGVCDRTPQVRDSIVQRLSLLWESPPRNCNEVTVAHLASIDELHLPNQGVTALKEDDFAGLQALATLNLTGNDLTTLPVDLFSELASLATLNLDRNDLTDLQTGVFSRLSRLTTLDLSFNDLATLRRNVFAGLSSLRTLHLNDNNSLSGNQLTILPGAFSGLSSLEELDLSDSRLAPLPLGAFTGLHSLDELDLSGNDLTDLPASVFAGLSSLTELDLSKNDIITLPTGIFDGLSLVNLDLTFNPGAPFVATVQLFRVDNEDLRAPGPAIVGVKLVAGDIREGSSPMPVPLPFEVGGIVFKAKGGTIRPGTLNTSTGETEIVKGILSSDAFRVTQTGDDPVTLKFHDAYFPYPWGAIIRGVHLEKGEQLVLFGGDTSIQDGDNGPIPLPSTTELVVLHGEDYGGDDVFVLNPSGVSSPILSVLYDRQASGTLTIMFETRTAVSPSQVSGWTLNFDPALAPALAFKDAEFEGTFSVGEETYSSYSWSGVAANFQSGGRVTLTIRPVDAARHTADSDAGVCDRTPQVRDAIYSALNKRKCEDITAADLASIRYLPSLSGKGITRLKNGDFAGLSQLERLELGGNQLAGLPGDVFYDLSRLNTLNLHGNDLVGLRANVFAGLSSLEVLRLGDNNLAALDVSLFAGLSRLGWLDLASNRLTALPSWVFRGLANLKRLDLQGNQLTALPVDIFVGLGKLVALHLERNRLAMLPVGMFADLAGLRRLNLEHNRLSSLPYGLFTGLSLSSKLILGSDHYLPVSPGTYLRLGSNPGTPFSLALELERSDHPSPNAPGPALVKVNLVSDGDSQMSVPLPFDLPLGMWVRDGTLSGSARIAAGQLESENLTVHQSHPVLQAPIGKPVTVGLYGDSWMDRSPHGFRSSGISITEGKPLVLFGGHVNENALPLAPAAPTFGPVFEDGLTVRWAAPANTGRPPVTRWNLQYRQIGEISWTAGPSVAPQAREATIAGLIASAAYEVQVRAVSREGAGAWSPPAATATSAALISFGAPSYPVTEGGTVAATVLLDRAFGSNVNIPLTATPGGRADAGDYTVPGSVSFGADEVTQTVIFQAHADGDAETGQEVTLGFGTLPTGIATGPPATAKVTIYDPVADNTPPTFEGRTEFYTAENTTHVGTLAAVDTNAGDTVTGYSFAGGVDDRQFTLGAESGVLEFARMPDHENPVDTRSTDPSNAANDNVYVVKVRAASGTGNRVLTTVRTVLVTVTNGAEPPDRPTPPEFGPVGPDKLTAIWGAPSNKGPAIHRYDIRYKADSDSRFTDGPQGVVGLSAVITGLRASTGYEVQVRAGNAEGDGEWSASGTGTTLAPEVTVPDMPARLMAVAVGRNLIELSWDAPANDGGSPITGYRIEVSADGGRRWTVLADTVGTARSYSHTGLAARTTRHYRVSAINVADVGAASAEARAVTAAAAVASEPWIVGINSRNGQVELAWNPPEHDGGSPITGYEVRIDGEGTWRRIGGTWIGDGNANIVYGVVRGLAGDRPYTLEVRATNAAGAGAASRPSAPITPKSGSTPTAGVTISPVALTVPEGGAASYTLRLTARPTHTVRVHPFWPGGDRDLTRGMQRYVPLTFEPDNWQIARTVTVEAVPDADSANGTAVFQHLLESEDPRYDDWWAAEVVATERDTGGTTAGQRRTAPVVAGLSVTTGPGADGVWSAGEAVEVTATFRQPVTVEVSGGRPSVAIMLGGARREAAYARGSGTASLVFVYRVVTSDGRSAAVRVAGEGIALNGGTIRSASTGIDATPAPSVTKVEILPPPDGKAHWGVGERVTVRVNFSEPVFVDTRYGGAPSIGIVIGGARLVTAPLTIVFTGGSGRPAVMIFAYMVTASDGAVDEVFVPADSIVLGGATIRDADGNDFLLAHSARSAGVTSRSPSIAVADARTREGVGAALIFRTTLSPIATGTVTVDYQTLDGTAKAGEDYRAVAGTLTFAPGDTAKTVRVSVFDDATDEGEETFTLTLSNAKGAVIADGEAKGVIVNADHMPRAWLSRFGRTVTGQVTDAVSERVTAPPPSSHVTLAGQRIELANADDGQELAEALTGFAHTFGAPVSEDDDPFARHGLGASRDAPIVSAPARSMTERELLLGSSFLFATQGEGTGPGLAVWGRAAHGSFDGAEDSDGSRTRVDGEVVTGILGADADWGRMLAGVAVSLSEGQGSSDTPGVDSGTVESTMTVVGPYARYRLTERISAWGLAGWGTGAMTMTQDANADRVEKTVTKTDLSMQLGAMGARGALLKPGEAGGMDLALKADAFFVRTEWDRVSNETDTAADVSRVRLVLEGGRAFEVGDSASLRPSLELGVRHDGGDAETGTGVELGGGVGWADPSSGLSVEAEARMLVTHADDDYEEWGASATVRLDPDERGRGLSFRLLPSIGATPSAAKRLWGAHDARALAPGGAFEAVRGLQAEASYGLPLFGGSFTGTHNLGVGLSDGGARDWSIGWWLTSVIPGDPGFEVSLDATRRKAANDNAEHALMLRSHIRW